MEAQREVRVLFHDIRSAHNVGSMLRTSDSAGVEHVYMSGYTPRPIDRFGRAVKEIAKTALGAEVAVPWTSVESVAVLITKLKQEGFTVVGLEQDKRSVDYRTHRPEKKILFLVGSEVEGMPDEIRALCDALLEIPMRGTKESLNVSVAFGIGLFGMLEG